MGSVRYDEAITVFSPDGHLFQVDYALESVKKGSTAVGICGKSIVVLGVERKEASILQVERTKRKIFSLDDHVLMAFAGLTADARILIDKARSECQSHKLMVEDPVTIEYITRHLAAIMQRHTQSNGTRPFGISALIAGFDYDGTPHLFQADPSGAFHEWIANSIGRNSKTVREYLESNYSDEILAEDSLTIKLTIKALSEVVQGKDLEIAIMKQGQPMRMLSADEIGEYVAIIEREKEQETRKKKKRK